MQYINFRSFTNELLNVLEIKLKRTHLLSRPIELSLEATMQCNSNCMMCNRNFSRKDAKNAQGFLSWDIFLKVKPFFKYAKRIAFGGFGEALLHPDYLSMLREIKRFNPYVYFFTNGILMTKENGRGLVDEGMDMICVSIGGATQETYKKIRGIDAFGQVVDNIKKITEYKKKTNKKKPIISFNVVAMKSMMHELEALVILARDIGVEHMAFPNMVVQGPEIESESLWLDVENSQRAFQKAKVLADKFNIQFISPCLDIRKFDCKDIFRRMSINWDGSVRSCALERYITGSLKEKDIASIWNSKGMAKLRKDYFEKGIEALCPNCTRWDNKPDAFHKPWINSREFAERVS